LTTFGTPRIAQHRGMWQPITLCSCDLLKPWVLPLQRRTSAAWTLTGCTFSLRTSGTPRIAKCPRMCSQVATPDEHQFKKQLVSGKQKSFPFSLNILQVASILKVNNFIYHNLCFRDPIFFQHLESHRMQTWWVSLWMRRYKKTRHWLTNLDSISSSITSSLTTHELEAIS
jgi:hypothetical protein